MFASESENFKKTIKSKEILIHIKKFVAIVFVSLMLMLVCLVAGCSNANSMPQIKLEEFPNTVVENSQVCDEYKDISKQLASDTLDEFMAITKIPHVSGHLDQISAYMQSKINEYGAQAKIDQNSGCIYADIPATNKEEYKNKPTVILQSHLDMVSSVADGYTGYDPYSMPVDAVYDNENHTIHSKDYKTNIGADDGQGMAFMLAALKNQNKYDHGPIRLLFTVDEETTTDGANKLSPSIVDAPYLINLDGYQIGNVLTSSAGTVSGEYTSTYNQVSPDQADTLLTLDVAGLAGGHTGVDVVKNRLRPSAYILQLFKLFNDNNIDYKISQINCGTTANAYATNFKLHLYIRSDQVEKAKELVNESMKQNKEKLKDENDFTFSFVAQSSKQQGTMSKEDTKKFVELLSSIPEGVIEKGKVSENVPETSCASTIVNISNGSIKTSVMFRSSNNETLNEYYSKFNEIGQKIGIPFTSDPKTPAWPQDKNNTLRDIMFESYNKVGKFEGIETATHGALETSYFLEKNPNIKMISIGLDFFNEHSVKETIYTNTVNMHAATLLYTLQHIK